MSVTRTRREIVAWDGLRAGDVIVCCDGTVWVNPRVVLSAERTEHGILLRTADEHGEEIPANGATYLDSFMWLVERKYKAEASEARAVVIRGLAHALLYIALTLIGAALCGVFAAWLAGLM